jgi:hypothetical protein
VPVKPVKQVPQVPADLINAFAEGIKKVVLEGQECSEAFDLVDKLIELISKALVPVLKDLHKQVNDLRAQVESAPVPEQRAAKATEDKTWAAVVKLQQDVGVLSSKAPEATAKLVQSTSAWGPPTPTAMRLQPLPNMGMQLETSRAESVAQVNGVIHKLGLLGDLVDVHPPRWASKEKGQATSSQATSPREGRKMGTAGTVFTMNPASAISFLSELRKQDVAARLHAMGWSIRLQLPVEQYRCKCALYNEHKTHLQGKKFHFVDQYTTLVVEGGSVFRLSPEQLQVIRAA